MLTIAKPPERPKAGDYLTDGRNLYWVEELFDDHALIEDCRACVLIDVDFHRLNEMRLVRKASASGGADEDRADDGGDGEGDAGDAEKPAERSPDLDRPGDDA